MRRWERVLLCAGVVGGFVGFAALIVTVAR